jgi:hypothetical protein
VSTRFVYESNTGRLGISDIEFDKSTYRVRWHALGYTDDDAGGVPELVAEAEIWALSVPLYNLIPKKAITCLGRDRDGVLHYEVLYKVTEVPFDDLYSVQEALDTTGFRARKTMSLDQERTARIPLDEAAFDTERLVGVDRTGKPQGVNVVLPGAKFTVSQKITNNEAADAGYQRFLAELTGSVNDAGYRGWGQFELLYTGSQMKTTGTDTYPVATHNFLFDRVETVSAGESSVRVGYTIQPHHAVWERTSSVESGTTDKVKVETVDCVYVETMYRAADFSGILLGGI